MKRRGARMLVWLACAVGVFALAVGGHTPASQAGKPCWEEGYNPLLNSKLKVLIAHKCSEEYKFTDLTGLFLARVGHAFALGERRLPRSIEELMKSPYFPIKPEDLWNPYQKRPVGFLTAEEVKKFKEADPKEKEKYLGDFATRLPTDKSLAFLKVVKGTVPNPEEPTLEGSYAISLTDFDEQILKEEYEQRFAGMDDGEKTMFAVCEYLNNTGAITGMYYPISSLPDSFEERARYHPLIKKLRNPYTGEIMREQDSPSPGNYKQVKGDPVFGEISTAICYNVEGKIIKPQRYLYKRVLESEKIRREVGLPPIPYPFPEGL